jgi:UDP-N-acetylglucosamine 4,6-dehydratase
VAGHKEGAAMTSLLVTGGTGTIGSAVIRHFLKGDKFDRIAVFSRDEQKQEEMRRSIDDARMRYFLGDVRDAARLRRAMEGVDTIVHAAALKCIHFGASNPVEFAKTNVDGSINVMEAALDNNVRRVVAISTDKAVEPICLYGATKLCAEGIFLHAKAYTGHRRTSFCVVRLGNIAHSRGSVIPYFNRLHRAGQSLPITDMDMTRYWVSQEQAQELIAEAIDGTHELYTPKAKAFRLRDLVSAYGNAKWHTVGLRDQERMYEKLDALRTSDEPDEWMSVDELRKEIACCS